MIDIPMGKALVPVEQEHNAVCNGCWFFPSCVKTAPFCTQDYRKDDKNVIFKLVDYPQEEKK